MPPKKTLQEELSSLPQAPTLVVLPIFEMAPDRTDLLYQRLSQTTYTFHRNLNAERMIQHLKQRGLVVDKKDAGKGKAVQQKKDKLSFEERVAEVDKLITEANPDIVLGNIGNLLMDTRVAARKEKASANDLKDDKKGGKAPPPKKDAKGKLEQAQPVKPIVQPTVNKACDTFTFVLDLPRKPDEMNKFFEGEHAPDVVLRVQEIILWQKKEVDMSLAQVPTNYEHALEQRMKKFELKSTQTFKESESDLLHKQERAKLVHRYSSLRQQGKNKAFCQVVYVEIFMELDLNNPHGSVQKFTESLYQRLGKISFQLAAYKDWLKARTVKPYFYELHLSALPKEEKKAQEPAIQSKTDKKAAKKQAKGKEDKAPQPVLTEQKKELKPKKQQPVLALSYFNKFKSECQDSSHPVESFVQLMLRNIAYNYRAKEVTTQETAEGILQRRKHVDKKEENKPENPLSIQQQAQFSMKVSCSGLSTAEFKRRDVLLEFHKMFKNVEPERKWDFADRVYYERLSKEEAGLRISRLRQLEPVELPVVRKHGQELHALYFRNPPGRNFKTGWRYSYNSLPTAEDWIQHIRGTAEESRKQFNHNNSLKYGLVGEQQQFFMPADDNLLMSARCNVGGVQSRRNCLLTHNAELQMFSHGQFNHLHFRFAEAGFRLGDIYCSQDKTGPMTIAIKDKGVIVRVESCVSIQSIRKQGSEESIRVILKDGAVKRKLANGTEELLMPTGERAVVSQGQVSLAQATEIKFREMGREVTVRSDKTIIVADQERRTCFFKDGTKIETWLNGECVQVGKAGHPRWRMRFDKIKALQQNIIGSSSSYAFTGAGNVLLRAKDSRCHELFFDSGVSLASYDQKMDTHEFNKHLERRVHVLALGDGSVIRASSDGEVVFLGGKERRAEGDDFWVQLFSKADDRRGGVYYGNVAKGILQTKDQEGNLFKIGVDSDSHSFISVSLDLDRVERPKPPPRFRGFDIWHENIYLPLSTHYLEPCLFLFEGDGSALQLFTAADLAEVFRRGKTCPDKVYYEDPASIQIYRLKKPVLLVPPFSLPLVDFAKEPNSKFERPCTYPLDISTSNEVVQRRVWTKQEGFDLESFKQQVEGAGEREDALGRELQSRHQKRPDPNQWDKLNFKLLAEKCA